MRRFSGVLLTAAMVLSVGLLATPAGAAGGPQCGALVTKTVGSTVTANVSKCTPTAATGGSGSGKFAAAPKGAKAGSISITITWATKHGTTKGVIKFAQSKTIGKCAKGDTRDAITGKVSGGSGTAFKTIKTGQAVTASVCIGKTSDTLEPGTALKL